MSVPASPPFSAVPHALARFPVGIQAAYNRFCAEGDAAAADQVLVAVILDFVPKSHRTQVVPPLADEARLFEDLGFDSLAVAEVVFFLEDLFRVRIPQEHLLQLRQVGQLRAYLRERLSVA